MRNLVKNFLPTAFITIAFVLVSAAYEPPLQPVRADNADSANIAIAEFTVLGMDSSTVGWVQERLDTVEGIHFNFACWADTIIFIEYDSLKTDKEKLMGVIKKLGYHPKPKYH